MTQSDKKLCMYKLTKINEARQMKRSVSGSVDQFKPIKLKSLQEARYEMKSSNPRTLSLSDETLSFAKAHSVDIIHESMLKKREKSLNTTMDQRLERPNLIFQEKPPEIIKEITRRKSSDTTEKINRSSEPRLSEGKKSSERFEKNRIVGKLAKQQPHVLKSTREKRGDFYMGLSPKKTPKRTGSTTGAAKETSQNYKKSKIVGQDLGNLLDLMDDITGNNSKKLSRNQEKGLIDRLQGKGLFRFSK